MKRESSTRSVSIRGSSTDSYSREISTASSAKSEGRFGLKSGASSAAASLTTPEASHEHTSCSTVRALPFRVSLAPLSDDGAKDTELLWCYT